MTHPAARILLVCGWAGAVELAALRPLGVLAVVVVPLCLMPASRAALSRLARRSRWLLGVLFLTYAWTLPGVAVWPELGALSPSLAGIEAGGLRVARLLLILAGVAALLAFTPAPRLVYGLYALTAPFARLGVDARGVAVRVGLTLEAARSAALAADWRAQLAGCAADGGEPTVYRLRAERWRARDGLALLAVAGLIAAVA